MPGGAETVRLIVEDTGVGVEEEHREKIFDAFYEARDVLLHSSGNEGFKAGGLGLGLAIARSVVDAHGGRLYYEPATPQGSRFIVELPGLTYGLRRDHGEEADVAAA